ncbi:hypothetical protein SAMN05421503_1445 [Terribacillus aidingensis]|uniref:Uncharacterized protein n=1 Tax=Terribacillus aidingensis TaxID=586416 RepID=A0A285NKC5_9BACI|nr:hypothetical protein [Terribacillus aidingensis]SNZ09974.1 hypothetical protein SAMN05421503_1445 [Terribacillus aidingensis]
MGAVKRDIHKHEHPFRFLSFSDEEVIEGLIRNRSEFDDFYQLSTSQQFDLEEVANIAITLAEQRLNIHRKELFLKKQQDGEIPLHIKFKPVRLMVNRYDPSLWEKFISASHLAQTNPEISAVYGDLDYYIHQVPLSHKQRKIIGLFEAGLREADIALLYNQKAQAITKNLKTACKKIRDQYVKQWKYSMADENYIKVEWNYSECIYCKKVLPLTEDFFIKDKQKSNGFKSKCKKCATMTQNG